jgi:hypothetical protein
MLTVIKNLGFQPRPYRTALQNTDAQPTSLQQAC